MTLIIGGGPGGLAAAACLQRHGIAYRLIDRFGSPGGAYRRMYSPITLSSPTRYLGLPGLPIRGLGRYVTVSDYCRYLREYATTFDIVPEKGVVQRVDRVGDRFLVHVQDEAPSVYSTVVVATGMCDYPVIPRFGELRQDASVGAPHPTAIHAHDWQGPAPYAGKRLLIIGGAMRAVEIAEECAAAGLKSVVSARSGVRVLSQLFFRHDLRDLVFPLSKYLTYLPEWVSRPYCQNPFTFYGLDRGYTTFRRAGLIEEKKGVERCDYTRASFVDGSAGDFDVVVFATGYRYHMPFLSADVARWPSGFPRTRRSQSKSWPGLFFIGMPCSRGLDSQFIHGISIDARSIARQIAARKARVVSRELRPSPLAPG